MLIIITQIIIQILRKKPALLKFNSYKKGMPFLRRFNWKGRCTSTYCMIPITSFIKIQKSFSGVSPVHSKNNVIITAENVKEHRLMPKAITVVINAVL